MAIALIAHVAVSGLNSPPIDTTGASLLAISVSSYSGAGATISDSRSNGWVPLTPQTHGSFCEQWYFAIPLLGGQVGSGHLFNVIGAQSTTAVHVYAFSGVGSYQTESGAGNAGSGLTGPLASGSVTPSMNGALILSALSSELLATDALSPAGFALSQIDYQASVRIQGSAGWMVQATAAPINPTWSWTGTHNHVATTTAVFLPGDPLAVVGPHRIQTTPRGTGNYTDTVSVTFGFPPQIGNAVVVSSLVWNSSSPPTALFQCNDNHGNGYVLVSSEINGSLCLLVFVGQTIVHTGAPFTVTITRTDGLPTIPRSYFEACAIEVTGVGTYLSVDRLTNVAGVGTTATTGTSLALTATDVFELALVTINGAQSAITVEVVTPPWRQELEVLPFGTTAGEIVSRTLNGVSGTTQSCSWTYTSSGSNLATFVAFKANTGTPPAPTAIARLSQVAVEIAVAAVAGSTTARVSQVAVEMAVAADASATTAKLSQVAVEIAYIPGPPHVTQDVVELLYEPKPASRVTQQVVELLSQSSSPIRTTQNVVELLRDSGTARAWLTQAVVETLSLPNPAGRLSHVVVETLTLATTAGRLSQVVVETLSLPSPAGRLSHFVIETLQYAPEVLPVGGALNTIGMGEMIGNLWVE